MAVPPIRVSGSAELFVHRRDDHHDRNQLLLYEELKHNLDELLSATHSIKLALEVQFPELRLIEYDCGMFYFVNVYIISFVRIP